MTEESKKVDTLMTECQLLRESNRALTDANNVYVTDLKNSRHDNEALIKRCQEKVDKNEELNKRERKAAEKAMDIFDQDDLTFTPVKTDYPHVEEYKVTYY